MPVAKVIDRMNRSVLAAERWPTFVESKTSLKAWVARNSLSMSLPTHLIEAVVAEITSSQGLSERSVREDVGLSDDSLSKLMQEIAERIKKREWQEDARWALEQWQNGEMQKLDTNCKYVAIYMKKFRGFGNDPTELQKRYANQFKTPQQRIFVSFIGNEDVLDVQGQS